MVLPAGTDFYTVADRFSCCWTFAHAVDGGTVVRAIA
jgi:hypothetical protein